MLLSFENEAITISFEPFPVILVSNDYVFLRIYLLGRLLLNGRKKTVDTVLHSNWKVFTILRKLPVGSLMAVIVP